LSFDGVTGVDNVVSAVLHFVGVGDFLLTFGQSIELFFSNYSSLIYMSICLLLEGILGLNQITVLMIIKRWLLEMSKFILIP